MTHHTTDRANPSDHAGARRAASLFGCCCAVVAMASSALGQLAPERLYYGKDRQMPMSVTVPDDAQGAARIDLLKPVTAEVAESASVAPGRVDLASLFPSLWSNPKPELLYAQLVVGDTPVGPAVVLQPMVSPVLFTRNQDPRGKPIPQPMGNVFSGMRAYPEQHVIFKTTAGDIEFQMRPDQAPNTVFNFMHLARGGFYTDIIFHRVIGERPPRAPFVAQVGDPTGTGSGGPGYFVDLEPTRLPHAFGVLSMARSGDPNSNGSQVFICLSRAGTSFLDGNYTAFAEAVDGADAIRAIGAVKTGAQDRPIDPPKIIETLVVDAPPYGTGPKALSTTEEQSNSDR